MQYARTYATPFSPFPPFRPVQGNYTGLYDYEAYPELAKFGLVDYDWANAKSTWVDQSPMDCDG